MPLVDPSPRAIACIEGFNVNGGRHMQLELVTAKPPSAFAACPVPERYRCAE
jgi:hypothetical protein